jgi:hypothetical protein
VLLLVQMDCHHLVPLVAFCLVPPPTLILQIKICLSLIITLELLSAANVHADTTDVM